MSKQEDLARDIVLKKARVVASRLKCPICSGPVSPSEKGGSPIRRISMECKACNMLRREEDCVAVGQEEVE